MKHPFFKLLALSAMLYGCTPDNKPNSLALREEMASRKVMRITDARMVELCNKFGTSLAKDLSKEIDSLGCTALNKYLIINRVKETTYGILLLDSLKIYPLTTKEAGIAEAYIGMKITDTAGTTNVQKLADTAIAYTQVLAINSKSIVNKGGCPQAEKINSAAEVKAIVWVRFSRARLVQLAAMNYKF